MSLWSSAVEFIAHFIDSAGQAVGLGPAIGLVAFAVRALLIPALAPLAAQTRARTRVARRIRPQVKELDRKYRDHPGDLSRRLKALHEANGIKMVDWAGLGGAFIQLPILIALFQAVLLVWEPEALLISAAGLGLIGGVISVASVHVGGQAEGAKWMLWLSGIGPVIICLWLGSGVGWYLIGFYAAGAIQAVLTRRRPAVIAGAEL